MIIHVLVEGISEATLLGPWLKRFQPGHIHRIVPHQGKGTLPLRPEEPSDPKHRGLLDQLPAKLRAYGRSLDPATDRVLALVDADDDDCKALKASMLSVWRGCNPRPEAMFRIAVEETEAFYLGDRRAIRAAFRTCRRTPYDSYVQDSVCGTWEVFQAVIGWRYEPRSSGPS